MAKECIGGADVWAKYSLNNSLFDYINSDKCITAISDFSGKWHIKSI